MPSEPAALVARRVRRAVLDERVAGDDEPLLELGDRDRVAVRVLRRAVDLRRCRRAVWTGRCAVTLRTVLVSTAPVDLVGDRLDDVAGRGCPGVTPTQQAPPGWLTSTRPRPGVAGSSFGVTSFTVPATTPDGWTISTVTGWLMS